MLVPFVRLDLYRLGRVVVRVPGRFPRLLIFTPIISSEVRPLQGRIACSPDPGALPPAIQFHAYGVRFIHAYAEVIHACGMKKLTN